MEKHPIQERLEKRCRDHHGIINNQPQYSLVLSNFQSDYIQQLKILYPGISSRSNTPLTILYLQQSQKQWQTYAIIRMDFKSAVTLTHKRTKIHHSFSESYVPGVIKLKHSSDSPAYTNSLSAIISPSALVIGDTCFHHK